MIYKDREARHDTDRRPADREDEECVHCGQDWNCHNGWACETWYVGDTNFSHIRAEHRYLTPSMKASILPKQTIGEIIREKLGPAPKAVQVGPDLSDWRTWAHHGQQPGHCVCRIPREKCDYHR